MSLRTRNSRMIMCATNVLASAGAMSELSLASACQLTGTHRGKRLQHYAALRIARQQLQMTGDFTYFFLLFFFFLFFFSQSGRATAPPGISRGIAKRRETTLRTPLCTHRVFQVHFHQSTPTFNLTQYGFKL